MKEKTRKFWKVMHTAEIIIASGTLIFFWVYTTTINPKGNMGYLFSSALTISYLIGLAIWIPLLKKVWSPKKTKEVGK